MRLGAPVPITLELTSVNLRSTLGVSRPKHPSRTIEDAIRYAGEKGWQYVPAGKSSHAWGRLKCPESSRDGCILSVWSTPKSSENHARQIRRGVDSCNHESANVRGTEP